MYTEKVMEHFRNPRNMGVIEDADGIGKVGNVICGDVMHLYIKVEKRDGKDYIKDVKFQTFGCASAIATSSVITELVKGKALRDVLKMTKDDIIKELGELPPQKIHCSVLAIDALNEAVYDYMSRNNLSVPESVRKRHEVLSRELEDIKRRHNR